MSSACLCSKGKTVFFTSQTATTHLDTFSHHVDAKPACLGRVSNRIVEAGCGGIPDMANLAVEEGHVERFR